MKSLVNIKIQQDTNGKKAVSAREMYLNLGLDFTHWQRWANKNIEKNPFAIQAADWVLLSSNNIDHSPSRQVKKGSYAKDYVLSLDFAKKLAMQVRTPEGEKVRDYFLEVERVAVTQANITPAELETRLRKLEAMNVRSEVSEFTVFGYSKYCNINVCGSEAMGLGKKAARLCRERNLPIGKIRDPRYGMINTYPESVLFDVFSEFVKKPRF